MRNLPGADAFLNREAVVRIYLASPIPIPRSVVKEFMAWLEARGESVALQSFVDGSDLWREPFGHFVCDFRATHDGGRVPADLAEFFVAYARTAIPVGRIFTERRVGLGGGRRATNAVVFGWTSSHSPEELTVFLVKGKRRREA